MSIPAAAIRTPFGWLRSHLSSVMPGRVPWRIPSAEPDPDREDPGTPIAVNGLWRVLLGKKYLEDLSSYLQNRPSPRP